MGLEHFSEKIIASRVNSRYAEIRAKLAVKRLICKVTKLTRQKRIELNYHEEGLQFVNDRWVPKPYGAANPIFDLYEGSCIRGADRAMVARIGLRVRESFIRGFSYDRMFNGTSEEAKLFFQISRYIYNLACGYGNPRSSIRLDMGKYIDAQWKEIYVKNSKK